MQLIKHELFMDGEIILMGDDHHGNSLSHSEGIAEIVDYVVAKKNRRLLHHGDELEGITIDDKRYNHETIDKDISVPLQQANRVIDTYWPIRKQMVTMVWGNHPMKLHRFGNLTAYICDRLGIPFGTFACKLQYTHKGKPLFKHFATHGSRSITSTAYDPIQREAAQKARLKKLLMKKAGDCVLMSRGHTHKLIIAEPQPELYLVDDGVKLKQRYTKHLGVNEFIPYDLRWCVSTGSMLRSQGIGVTSYSEAGEYDPIELGYVIVSIQGGQIVDARKVII